MFPQLVSRGLQSYLLVWEPDLWGRAGQWCDGGHVGAASSSALLADLEVGGLVAVGGAVAVVVRDALLLVHRGVCQLLDYVIFW